MKYLLSLPIFLAITLFSSQLFTAQAQNYGGGCSYEGQCVNRKTCTYVGGWIIPEGPECGSAMVGSIAVPEGVRDYDWDTSFADGIGLVPFISRLLQFFTVIVGIFSMFNIISIGYTYISGMGDPQSHVNMRQKFQYTVLGLVLIAAAYAIAGGVGLLFFGDAGYILFPRLVSFTDI